MRCGLCGFLIIKPQTALHHAVWCSAVHNYLRCGAVIPFCRRFLRFMRFGEHPSTILSFLVHNITWADFAKLY